MENPHRLEKMHLNRDFQMVLRLKVPNGTGFIW